jgi:prolipoprotein diacylglyceryltransferase
VQLYEAGAELVLFVVLSLVGRRKRWDGQVLCLWLVGYSAARFVLEALRGDALRKFVVAGLSTSQAIALAAAALGIAILAWRRRRVVASQS